MQKYLQTSIIDNYVHSVFHKLTISSGFGLLSLQQYFYLPSHSLHTQLLPTLLTKSLSN